jgi:hypothetical protein
MVIKEVKLLEKSGGKSGTWVAEAWIYSKCSLSQPF